MFFKALEPPPTNFPPFQHHLCELWTVMHFLPSQSSRFASRPYIAYSDVAVRLFCVREFAGRTTITCVQCTKWQHLLTPWFTGSVRGRAA
jgi:hypothetical protein